MNNQKGSAIAIVMIVLGVMSLMGVAALLRSRLDLQLSSAMHSHQRLVNHADAGAAMGVRYLSSLSGEITWTSYLLPPSTIGLTPSSGDPNWGTDSKVGGAEMMVTIRRQDPPDKCPAGYSQDTTQCEMQRFLIEGKSRGLTYMGAAMDKTETVVEAYATRIVTKATP